MSRRDASADSEWNNEQKRGRKRKLAEEHQSASRSTDAKRRAMQRSSDDFRNCPVLPTQEMLYDETASQKKLQPNRTTRGFFNLQHYLKVNFRLLHEDFLQPLRNGIREYRKFMTQNQNQFNPRRFQHDDLRVYYGVKFHGVFRDDSGISWQVGFDVEKNRNISWHKRLLAGNLLCFSKDNFDSIAFGTVSMRNERNLARGRFRVHFNEENLFKLDFNPYQVYTIIEPSSSYFVAYQSVLEGLQQIETLPFERYLVDVKFDKVDPPAYLRPKNKELNAMEIDGSDDNSFDDQELPKQGDKNQLQNESSEVDYDFAPLLSLTDVAKEENSKFSFNQVLVKRSVEKLIRSKVPRKVLHAELWPTANYFQFDSSQYEALRNAVTHELSVIQGPPGTGKTFIGLKLVQLLLHNKRVWQGSPLKPADSMKQVPLRSAKIGVPSSETNRDRQGPILVVCYTNHALDQFLEGIVNTVGFKENEYKMVRVGGQTKSEVIGNYALYKQRGNRRYHLPWENYNTHRKQKQVLDTHAAKIGEVCGNLFIGSRLLDYANDLQPIIFSDHRDSLESWASNHYECILCHWLGMDDQGDRIDAFNGSSNSGQMAKLGTNIHAAHANNQDNDEGLFDKLILQHDVEEAARIQQERQIEGEGPGTWYGFVGRAQKKHAKTRRRMTRMHKKNNIANVKHLRKECCNANSRPDLFNRFPTDEVMADHEVDAVMDVWTLNERDRWRLYRYWVQQFVCEQSQKLREYRDRFEEELNMKNLSRDNLDVRILRDADVIGMTTTGAANIRHILQQVRPRIVIVEEAAEILEAHVITVLSPYTEHLILIGDHQQLRPKVTVHEMASKYKLDISMFERLVKSGMPVVQLNIQHRMRPEIASLISPTIYENLQNSDSVTKYPRVIGVKENVFFVSHRHAEDGNNRTKSYSNEFEAKFLCRFYEHLQQQGYKEEQITVLCPYIGQMFCLQREFVSRGLSKSSIKVVDNYQGEENDILLISLVRSNSINKIGFMKLPNRACVLL